MSALETSRLTCLPDEPLAEEVQQDSPGALDFDENRYFPAADDQSLFLNVYTGSIFDVSPHLAKLLGYSRREMIDRNIGELAPFKEIVSHQAMLELLQQFSYVVYESLHLETNDGRHLCVKLTSDTFSDGAKKLIRCKIHNVEGLGSSTDIREEKRVVTARFVQQCRCGESSVGTPGLQLPPA